MFCKKCGNQIPDGVNFCKVCGTPVSQAAAPELNQNTYRSANANPYPYPNQNQPYPNGSPRGYNGGTHMRTPSFVKGGKKTTLLSVMFLLAAATMFCMIFSGTAMSAMGYGLSLPNTALSALMGDDAGAFGVYTVFLVIYIIINICAVFLIFNRKKYGIIAGLFANLLAFIFSIVAICAAFGLGGGTYPTIWTWLALVLALANDAFLAIKGWEIV